MAKMWISDRRLYWTADNKLTTDSGKAVSLCCGIGGEIPLSWAEEAGFVVKRTEHTEPWIDTDRDAKMAQGPQENKMIAEPQENKAKKVRAA